MTVTMTKDKPGRVHVRGDAMALHYLGICLFNNVEAIRCSMNFEQMSAIMITMIAEAIVEQPNETAADTALREARIAIRNRLSKFTETHGIK